MADAEDLRRGMRVRVTFDNARDDRDARITKVPPWTETAWKEEVEYTDKAEVVYPGSSIGRMFGDIREAVDLEQIEIL